MAALPKCAHGCRFLIKNFNSLEACFGDIREAGLVDRSALPSFKTAVRRARGRVFRRRFRSVIFGMVSGRFSIVYGVFRAFQLC